MAFSSSNLFKIVDAGLADGISVWRHYTSDSSTKVQATGYFAGVGAGGRGTINLGMKIGDTVLNQESSAGNTPGRSTMHGVWASSADQASTVAATGWNARYDCTVAQAT